MTGKKHALLFFSKAPLPGLTKTRLTEERGGILTPQEAADLYQASMLDVAEIGFRALQECNDLASVDNGSEPERYDFIVSCSPESEQPHMENLFAEAGPWPAAIQYINDHGRNFDEHFDDAFRQLFESGYHSVVSIGGDLPTLPANHVVSAFQWLAYLDALSDRGGLVLAPCQECGVSLVGLTANAPMDFTGVFYNLDGVPALDAFVAIAAERGIPMASLNPVADIDDTRDLAHAVSLMRAMAYASNFQPDIVVPRRTLAWIERTGIVINTPPNPEHDPRERVDARD